MKYYAVKNGFIPGIYTTWSECQKQTIGFKGAVFKSFKTRLDAENFIKNAADQSDSVKFDEVNVIGKLVAYTDGSFTDSRDGFPCKAGYGICFVLDGRKIGFAYGPELDNHVIRNIGGEIKAVEEAINIAKKHNYKQIVIIHDLLGIQMWSNNVWKCNTVQSKKLREFIELNRNEGMEILFGHIKGHSKDKFNDEADHYAAIGAELRPGEDVISFLI